MSIKVGVIGVGYLGRHHARIYADIEDARLEAVIDPDKARAEEIAGRHGGRAYTDYKEAVDGLHAVSIATPTSSHYEIAIECLRQGKDLLIEKPIALTVREADALINEAEKKGCILQVGHLERYNPAVVAVSGLVREPVYLEAERVSPFLGRAADVDVMIDLMIHDIDIISGLLKGSAVSGLNAVGASLVTDKTDFAKAWLEFKCGATAVITASRVAEDTKRELRIFQKDSLIVLDYKDKKAKRYVRTPEGMKEEAVEVQEKEPLKEELIDFINCVKTRRRPVVSGVEARDALSVAVEISGKIKNKTKGG